MTTTPLPNPQFTILMAVRFIEPVAFTILFPFVYFMVQDFKITDDLNMVAYYAGFIASSFAIAEFFSGVPWGMLSDRIGRKPVLMMGLFGTMISMILFGLSKSLAWAIVTRSLCGVLNGNIGVLKSMVGEMTDRTNRAEAFSYTSMMYGMGTIVGPVIGGLLSNPVKTYPAIFGGNRFLTEYPYFLPCGIGASLCFIGIIFAHFYLEETLESIVLQKSKSVDTLVDLDPSTKLLNTENQKNIKTTSLSNYGALDQPKLDTKSMQRSSSSVNTLSSTASTEIGNEETLKVVNDQTITVTTWYVILANVGLSFMTSILDELFPFWAATKIASGGLSFNEYQIGLTLSFAGVVLFIFQMLVFPPIQRRFGTLPMFQSIFLLYAPVLLLLPNLNTLASTNQTNLLWVLLFALFSIRSCCGVIAFTSYNILLPESCPSKASLGKINGISQALGSLMRGIGPAFCGWLWSWSLTNNLGFPFDFHFTFYIVVSLCLVNHLFVRLIKPEGVVH